LIGKLDVLRVECACIANYFRSYSGNANGWRNWLRPSARNIIFISQVIGAQPERTAVIRESLNELGLRLGFRTTEGFAERAIYRELFPRGLIALDDLDEIMPFTEPDPLCLTARQEVRTLLDTLRLPLDERGRRRAAARAQWFASHDNPLDTHDILDT